MISPISTPSIETISVSILDSCISIELTPVECRMLSAIQGAIRPDEYLIFSDGSSDQEALVAIVTRDEDFVIAHLERTNEEMWSLSLPDGEYRQIGESPELILQKCGWAQTPASVERVLTALTWIQNSIQGHSLYCDGDPAQVRAQVSAGRVGNAAVCYDCDHSQFVFYIKKADRTSESPEIIDQVKFYVCVFPDSSGNDIVCLIEDTNSQDVSSRSLFIDLDALFREFASPSPAS